MKDFREGQVFKFRYPPKKEQGWDARYHCFEGILVAKDIGGQVVLIDTYWGIGDSSGAVFTKADIFKYLKEGGKLEYYCNLNEIESINEYDTKYYADEDLFEISDQHRCIPSCIKHFKRKGAKRSKDKMMSVLKEQERKARQEINYKIDALGRVAVNIDKVEDGNLDISI